MAKNLALAVDVGGTNLRTAIISRKGKIIAKSFAKTAQKGKSGRVIAEQIVGEIKKIIGSEKMKDYKGIGVSIAGPIDYKKGASLNPPNMNFSFVPVVKPLERAFGIPVSIINDCNAGALGEKSFGKGKKVKNLVYVTLSSGIGGGAFVNNKLLLGRGGNAAEVGHFMVDTKYNLPCSCRKGRGHWEAYASGNNLPKFFKIWAKGENLETEFPSKAEEIFEAVRKGNENVLRFMEELGKINGRGMSNIIVAYDPEVIVLGGAVALNNFDIIVKYALPNIDRFLKIPKIFKSSLGKEAPLLGAAVVVFEKELLKN